MHAHLIILTLLATTQAEPMREDARTLLLRVVENQEWNQERQREYTFRETVVTQFLRKDGTVKKKEAETFEVLPAPGGEYRRLVSRNGKPLPPAEEAKEEEKLQEYIKKRLAMSPAEIERKNRNLKTRLGRFESRIREALEVFDFAPLPDEEVSGRRVRVFEFSPRPGYEPHSRATNVFSRTKGTVWIDPEWNQIVKLYIRFREDMSFALGLFGRISKGTEGMVEQLKVGDDIWLLGHVDVYLNGRFYFLKKYNRRVTYEYTDYKKYTVSTEERIAIEAVTRNPQ